MSVSVGSKNAASFPPTLLIALSLTTGAALTSSPGATFALCLTRTPLTLVCAPRHATIPARLFSARVAFTVFAVADGPHVPIPAVTEPVLGSTGPARALLTGAVFAPPTLALTTTLAAFGARGDVAPLAALTDPPADLVAAFDTPSRPHHALRLTRRTALSSGAAFTAGTRLDVAPTHTAPLVAQAGLNPTLEATRRAHLTGVHLTRTHAPFTGLADEPLGTGLSVGVVETPAGGAHTPLNLLLSTADDGSVTALVSAHLFTHAFAAGARRPGRAGLRAGPRGALELDALGEVVGVSAPPNSDAAGAVTAPGPTPTIEADSAGQAWLGFVPARAPEGGLDAELSGPIDTATLP